MAVMKRGNSWFSYFRPFKTVKVGLKLDVETKAEAAQVEGMLLRACRQNNYGLLDGTAREAAIRMFQHQGWQLPPELGGSTSEPQEALTLWKATQVFLTYPEIAASANRWRHEFAFTHVVEKLGKDKPVESIRVSDVKMYQVERLKEGAAESTINKELSALSRLFGVLIELELIESNPCRLVKHLSEKSGQRQVYLSLADVEKIANKCVPWYQQMIWMAYYTGMRRGEIVGLTWKEVHLAKRMIVLPPEATKESAWKRIPLRQEVVAIFEEAMKLRSLTSDQVFLLQDEKGLRPPTIEAVKNPWGRACEALKKAKLMKEPFPRFHDLRHTWKTNARRSGMDPEIRESILGHSNRTLSVSERYGRISYQELLSAVDRMSFDHGDTEILVAKHQQLGSREKGNKMVTNPDLKKKGHGVT